MALLVHQYGQQVNSACRRSREGTQAEIAGRVEFLVSKRRLVGKPTEGRSITVDQHHVARSGGDGIAVQIGEPVFDATQRRQLFR